MKEDTIQFWEGIGEEMRGLEALVSNSLVSLTYLYQSFITPVG